MPNKHVTIKDEELDKLVESGDISSYSYQEVQPPAWRLDQPSYHSLVMYFPSGNKLVAFSFSTPAPESSGLTFEYVDKSVKLT